MKYIYILLFLPVFAFSQERLYVNASATGSNTGTSWADAHPDLQTALHKAKKGDTVWVAQGTYRPTPTTNRRISFELPSGVHLYGGFAGTETQATQRNYPKNLVTLSGDIGVPGDSTDNTLCVLYLFRPDSNTVVDGLTIRDGVANVLDPLPDFFNRLNSGAGVYVMGKDWDAYPDFLNCSFVHNTAFNSGGGVFVNGDGDGSVAPRFFNCRFENNRAVRGDGGGLARMGASWVERGTDLDSCVFTGNYAGHWGGGYYYQDSERSDRQEIRRCAFTKNATLEGGSAAYLILGRTNPKEFILESTNFENNIATSGSILHYSPRGFLYGSDMKIKNCIFKNNTSKNINSVPQPDLFVIDQLGLDSNNIEIDSIVFIGNTEFVYLFSLICDKAHTRLNAIDFSKNLSHSCIFLSEGKSINLNGINIFNNSFKIILSCSQAIDDVTLSNSVIKDNNLFYINENFYDIISPGMKDSMIIVNSLISHTYFLYTPNKIYIQPGYLVFKNSALIGSFRKDLFLMSKKRTYVDHSYFNELNCSSLHPSFNIHCGPNNLIGIDPLFRDAANGDYTLLPCSPLINAGDNSATAGLPTDLAGNPRIQGGRVDIGPYEMPAFAAGPAPVVQAACAGTPNGRVSLRPLYGCPPYTYRWRSDTGQKGSDTTALAPGRYVFTLTDARNQVAFDTLTVPASPRPVPALVPEDVLCGSSTGGTLRANVPAGVPAPVRYRWSDQPAANTAVREDLLPGRYALTVTDALGCQDSAAATLARVGTLAFAAGGTPISCHGRADGTLWVQPSNGKAPYTYAWNTGARDSLLTGIAPQTYSVTLTDALGCTATFPFFIKEPDSLRFFAEVQDATDSVSANGSIAIQRVEGGTRPYRYAWSTGSTDAPIGQLRAGTYTAVVRDSAGCESVQRFAVRWLVGTEEALGSAGRALLIWPNPAVGVVQVSGGRVWAADRGIGSTGVGGSTGGGGTGIGTQRLRLWDGQGRLVLETAFSAGSGEVWQCAFDLSTLPAGVYVAEAADGQRGRVVKL